MKTKALLVSIYLSYMYRYTFYRIHGPHTERVAVTCCAAILNRTCARADHQSPGRTRRRCSVSRRLYCAHTFSLSSTSVTVEQQRILSYPEKSVRNFEVMIAVVKPRDACLYEIRQKGQKDPCYVVVPNPKVRCRYFLSQFFFIFKF